MQSIGTRSRLRFAETDKSYPRYGKNGPEWDHFLLSLPIVNCPLSGVHLIMPFYVYILVSDEGYHYTGHTAELSLRLERHQLKTTQFTKRGTNWRVIHTEEFLTRSESMKREKWLKSGVGRAWAKANVAGWSPPKAE